MGHVERVVRQSYLVECGDVVKLEDKNGAKKATKCEIIDFFICKADGHNTIYPN